MMVIDIVDMVDINILVDMAAVIVDTGIMEYR